MIAFAFTFPAGRYHATPWGRHVNEADVAWPPEPVRVLRALIATWWRKADQERFPKASLDGLIDTLACEAPVFRLPENVVHSHVRAFMPAPTEKRLIFDAFLCIDPSEELIVAWPSATFATDQQRELAEHLLERIGYLGRAESWASARLAADWDGAFNSQPRASERGSSGNSVPVDIAVPLTPAKWTEFRDKHIGSLEALAKSKRATIEATLPARLADALSLDTGEWHDAGWSSPPAMEKVVYDRPKIGPVASLQCRKPDKAARPGNPQVARFVLAGRPQPRIEDALRIGEIARRALMSKFGGRSIPEVFSGRDGDGPLRDDPAHKHAFFLPETAGSEGVIDHLIVYSGFGFDAEERGALDRLTSLWFKYGQAGENGERGREEWRLALEDIAAPDAFKSSRLLGRSKHWISVTPYLMPWFSKRNLRNPVERHAEILNQIQNEIERRGFDSTVRSVEVLDYVGGKRAVQFRRFRSRRNLSQPDQLGQFVKLSFDRALDGPLCLGFACHYGLGSFQRVEGPASA